MCFVMNEVEVGEEIDYLLDLEQRFLINYILYIEKVIVVEKRNFMVIKIVLVDDKKVFELLVRMDVLEVVLMRVKGKVVD